MTKTKDRVNRGENEELQFLLRKFEDLEMLSFCPNQAEYLLRQLRMVEAFEAFAPAKRKWRTLPGNLNAINRINYLKSY